VSVHNEAKRFEISGIVQGVGFRPFVYQLAHRYDLKGEVANTSAGVTIHIEGEGKNLESFRRDLVADRPPLAQITDISVRSAAFGGFSDFSIVKSKGGARRSTLISPDVSVCGDCIKELTDPTDRRFEYPFTNCTNCGPRYTIIDDIPYDRPGTSMKHFKMCAACQAEYDNPLDRRFHAQPNACGACGPHVSLVDNQGKSVETSDPIGRTSELLRQGFIVAVKGLGGFHLVVDSENEEAVGRLRERKGREEKPFALMSPDPDRVRSYARVDAHEMALLTSIQRPIVLLKKREPNAIAAAVSPRNRYFGVMLPYTPLHHLLLGKGHTALVMTSGNISEEPICIDNDEAFGRLGAIADYFLVHNRDIYLRSDDSIVRRSAGSLRLVRRSRGYVPVPVFLHRKLPPVVACGAELKNTVCLTTENRAFLSQHIGDLENLETYNFLKLTVEHLQRILDIRPEVIACDLHPDYMSTRYAGERADIEKIQVQHHHAHIVSCMAENRIDGPVIGLAFDGTGYGTDGNIWGGEVLIAEATHFTRAAHLDYVAMPGSAAAVREPWRMAVSYLYAAFGDSFSDLDLPVIESIGREKIHTIRQMIVKHVNAPLTSSLGRLFDGVAAITGIRNRVFYEGQAAMEMEMAVREPADAVYDFEWNTESDVHIISPLPIIRGVVEDMEKRVPVAVISARFHATLIGLFAEICDGIRKETGLDRVALSGGSFQNEILLSGMVEALEKIKIKVFTHTLVPANDGGISLGQAVAAGAMI